LKIEALIAKPAADRMSRPPTPAKTPCPGPPLPPPDPPAPPKPPPFGIDFRRCDRMRPNCRAACCDMLGEQGAAGAWARAKWRIGSDRERANGGSVKFVATFATSRIERIGHRKLLVNTSIAV